MQLKVLIKSNVIHNFVINKISIIMKGSSPLLDVLIVDVYKRHFIGLASTGVRVVNNGVCELS